MTKLYNIKSLTRLRKKLRSQPIKAEWLLWSKLKMKQLGYKFRRQYSVGPYILDFYCPLLRLGIEADGSTHGTQIEINSDRQRENELNKYGIKIIRYKNHDIFNNLEQVISDIKKNCDKIKNTPPHPPLIKGRNS